MPDAALVRKWLRYHALFRPLGRLPSPLGYRLADIVGRVDRRRQAAASAAVRQGLREAFPALDEARVERCVNEHFTMLARELTDAFKMRHLSVAAGQRLARPAPGALDVLRAARAGGRGVIIAMGHYGRVNMLLLGLALAGERLGMLTMVSDQRNPQLDAVDRPYIDAKIRALLAFTGGPWVTLADDLRRLYDALHAGQTLVILLDAYLPEHPERKLTAPFLGGTLRVSRGIERLARKTGASVLYGCARERGVGVEAELRPLRPRQDSGWLGAAIAELENDIIAAPGRWWQWGLLSALWERSTSQTAAQDIVTMLKSHDG
jgi:KDO2-lipid IV(A) lauroyltransferase